VRRMLLTGKAYAEGARAFASYVALQIDRELHHPDEEVRKDITILFTDIEMPGSMDGLKLAFAVRVRWPPVSIIIASGRIRPDPHEMPPEVQFLRKPHTEVIVMEAIKAA